MVDFHRLDPEVLDINLLQTWHKLSRPGEDDFLRDLARIFLHRAPTLLQNLQEALSRHDSLALEQAAHALKGSSCNMGARIMTEVCELIEFQAPTLALAGPTDPTFQKLVDSFNHVKGALESFAWP